MRFAFTQGGYCPFRCGRAGFAEHGVVNRNQPVVEFACEGDIALKCGAAHIGKEFRGGVGCNGNDAVPAAQHERQGGMVVAGKDGEAFGGAVDEFDVAADVAAGFFNTHVLGISERRRMVSLVMLTTVRPGTL